MAQIIMELLRAKMENMFRAHIKLSSMSHSHFYDHRQNLLLFNQPWNHILSMTNNRSVIKFNLSLEGSLHDDLVWKRQYSCCLLTYPSLLSLSSLSVLVSIVLSIKFQSLYELNTWLKMPNSIDWNHDWKCPHYKVFVEPPSPISPQVFLHCHRYKHVSRLKSKSSACWIFIDYRLSNTQSISREKRIKNK